MTNTNPLEQVDLPTDGNFFSMVSAGAMSLASNYCIGIPLLQGSDNPMAKWRVRLLFYISIFFSMSSAVASISVYYFNQRGSMGLGFLSSLASLIATILWILASSKKIKSLGHEVQHLGDEVQGLGVQVHHLETELMHAREGTGRRI